MARARPTESHDLHGYLRVWRRRIGWLVVPLVLFPAAAAYYTASQPLAYRATARVLLDESAAQDAVGGSLANANVRTRELANEINLARSDSARQAVREALGLGATEALPTGTITADDNSDVLLFRFEGSTANDAALAANTWATGFVDLEQEAAQASLTGAIERLNTQLDEFRVERDSVRVDLVALEDRRAIASTDKQRATLQVQIDREAGAISGELNLVDAQIDAIIQSITQLQLDGELAPEGTAWIYRSATPPLGAINGSILQNTAIGLVVGVMVGVGLALFRDHVDRSVSTTEDIQRLGLTALGAIPQAPRGQGDALAQISLFDPTNPVADSYQKVRSALQFVALGRNAKSILVTSPTEGNGKTTTAVNLALAFSGVDHKVVLVDADMRRPKIHTIFNTNRVPGVSDAIVEGIPLDRIAVASSFESRASLAALPAGTEPPSPAAFLASPGFASLHDELETQSDMTVFDTPPVLPVADATSLCPYVDGVVVVVEVGRTTQDQLLSAVDILDRAGGEVFGIVLTKAKVTTSLYYQQDR
ncbi:MAG: polysaccharide biosynthesis tyrosine autokinase [Actinomycetia bacterium]|nr:polysaccharide biosynthesis tyrosine autokinase [Actinomycetes bacterium]